MNDPRSVTQAEANLLASIVANIVEPDVLAPMEAIGWQHGAPPDPSTLVKPAPATDNPAATVPTPTADHKPETVTPVTTAKPDNPVTPAVTPAVTQTPESIDWEALREPNGLIAGKYKTAADAVKGLSHLAEMTRGIRARAEAAEKQVQEYATRQVAPQNTPNVTLTPAQETVVESRLNAVLDGIAKDGGMLDENNTASLRDAIREEMKLQVTNALAARDAVVQKENDIWTDVDAYMRKNHPESVNFTEEMSLFKQANPLIALAIDSMIEKGKQREAAEFAWTEYQKDVNGKIATADRVSAETKEVKLIAAEEVRKEAVAEARKDAGVVTSAVSGTHENPQVGVDQDEINQLGAAMQRGDVNAGVAWRNAVFGSDLKGPLFD